MQKTDEYLHKAVKRRIESSDLEVGSFLSGGIDSGIITAIASKYNSNLKTFTVSFEGEYDEAPLGETGVPKNTRHIILKSKFRFKISGMTLKKFCQIMVNLSLIVQPYQAIM